MADTRQIVQWALRKSCALRNTAESETDASKAQDLLSQARAYGHYLRSRENGFGVFGDVVVTSYTFATLPAGGPKLRRATCYYPSHGFLVSESFASLGGPEKLSAMCYDCPANVWKHEIASCCGDIFQSPESPDTDAQIHGIISRLALKQTMEEAFPATKPVWYGLWAVSPIPSASLPVLRTVLEGMLAEDQRDMEASGKVDDDQLRQFATLISAIERAESAELELHVKLMPLGHTDFGVHTVFPHCPFCKAAAKVERWQRRYESAVQTCHACGTRFSPADTASATRMKWERRGLRETLGEEAFRAFAAYYLVERGETPERAAAIVEATEAAEITRKEIIRRNSEKEAQRTKYLQEHIYSGLPCVEPPPPEFPVGEDTEESAPIGPSSGWFGAEEMAEVLKRCGNHGIKVTMLQHHSAGGDCDRFEMMSLNAPLETLAKWVGEGCGEKFFAACRVPDALLEKQNH